MYEYTWKYLNKQDFQYASVPKYAKILTRPSSQHAPLHSVLNMLE